MTFINVAYFRRFVLRRSILQEAIEMAEKANYHLVNVLLQMGEDPFSDKPGQRGRNNAFVLILKIHQWNEIILDVFCASKSL